MGAVWLVWAGLLPAADAPAPAPVAILDIDTHTYYGRWSYDPDAVRSTWRYWDTWQTEVIRLSSPSTPSTGSGQASSGQAGELVRMDCFKPFDVTTSADGKKDYGIRKAARISGSDFPSDGWQNPDFDDGAWYRQSVAMREGYRSLALICARGKFTVTDPASAPELSLSVVFHGGLVAYLNGREIGRSGLPAGRLSNDTLADPYPRDVYLNKDGVILSGDDAKNADIHDRYLKRLRKLEVRIPPSALRKGVNVLALEGHRAPADEAMVKEVVKVHQWAYMLLRGGPNPEYRMLGDGCWWNRLLIEEIKLTAPTNTAAVIPNISRPKGFQVWNETVFKLVTPLQFGDPNEPLQPVRLRGVKNGTCSGVLVVGSSDDVNGLKAVVTDLNGDGGARIPASAVSVGYARWEIGDKDELQYESLDDAAPAVLPVMKTWGRDRGMGAVAGVVQPIWFTLQVPKDAKAGAYTGKVTITADGVTPVETPIQLRVIGDWVAPDPRDFSIHIGLLESPDSISMQYNVPMWSEAHWKLIDRTFALMGQMANREVYVPLITRTQLGNEHSMVRWLRQPDGTFAYDFSIAERYLDLAVKHFGRIGVVGLYIHDPGFSYANAQTTPFTVTELVASTQELKPMAIPKWGTPESQAFWKPVVDGMMAILAKRGIQNTAMFSMASNSGVLPEIVDDLKAIAPQVKWADCTHLWFSKEVGRKDTRQAIGRLATAGGAPLGVMWDPEEDPPHYNWKPNPKDSRILVAGPRGKCTPYLHECLAHYRLICETTMLSSYDHFSGFGEIGADFWPVLKTPEGGNKERPGKRLDNRYVYWGSLNLSSMVNVMLGAGRDRPVHTCRSQMFRESLQEYQARGTVQDALLDEAQKAKLGPELAALCKKVCDERTRTLRYCSFFFAPSEHLLDYGRMFNQEQWDAQTEPLYVAAGKVARALGN